LFIDILCIFVGGIVGTLLRYGIGVGIDSVYKEYFDLGTLVANYLGCLFAGLLAPFSSNNEGFAKYLVTTLSVGLCGSLTTFSGYASHSIIGLQDGHVLSSLGEVLFNIIGCFLFLWLGIIISKWLKSKTFMSQQIVSGEDKTDSDHKPPNP
jgi:CrcB protein